MNAPAPPTTESGWVEDPATAPHLVLCGPIGQRTEGPVTVDGRRVLALPPDGDSGLVRAVDLATGTVLPDRSLLRYQRHEVLALGAGRPARDVGRATRHRRRARRGHRIAGRRADPSGATDQVADARVG
ncbi:hypothetical protein ACN27G_02315 [Plantactinospora sp. WMMB334]|uniref:hypothetical protein n=1 Tax=Plantactinospora sp. WMMB334 TaxID=3404119 RepID=UPI003B932DCF